MQINQMRFAGLASGIDTETIVNDLMRVERLPLDKLVQKRQQLEWQRDSYREVNQLAKNFDTLIFDSMARQATFLKKTVSSSNEQAVSARALGSANNVSSQVQVNQLATSEVWVSNKIDSSFTVAEIGADITLTFKVTQPGEQQATEVTVELAETDTLTDVVRKLNHSNLGVTIFEDPDQNGMSTLVMTMNRTGAGAQIELVDNDSHSTADFMNGLGFGTITGAGGSQLLTSGYSDLDDPSDMPAKHISGQNALFTINGYETERTTNVFTINGMEYTLKNVTDSPVTITTATDTESIFDAVVTFVNEYNTFIEDLNGRLTESVHRDFPPLTDEQREEMTEKQIEMWEEKAKSGLLRNDSIISRSLNQMRIDLYTAVEREDQTRLSLADFGITSSTNYLERGKLEINEDKLRAMIAEDPNQVYELFNGSGASDSYETSGLVTRMRSTLKAMTNQIEERAGNQLRTNHQFTLGLNLIDVNDRIERMQVRLQRVEESYWRQFTAMEKAVQQANQQSLFLMEQFGGF